MGRAKGASATTGSFSKGHAYNAPKDKFGKVHKNAKDAEYANLCYDMVEFLNDSLELQLDLESATELVEKMRDSSPRGHVVRTKLSTFITLINHYQNRNPGRL